MMGIYKYTNKINNKSYIGQSVNLESRYKQHKRNFNNSNLSTFNGLFYRALRKYGYDNFTYTILYQEDRISQEKLNELEIYYIKKYDSFKNGYNMNIGGNYTSSKKILDDVQVIEIKNLLLKTDLSFADIGKKYEVSYSTISQINNGLIWKLAGNYVYPIRPLINKGCGGKNANHTLTDEEVMKIRIRFVQETLPQIYEDYKSIISFSELKKIVYGSQFTHLPCYKKRNKQWMLNGKTCIDYPRVEE